MGVPEEDNKVGGVTPSTVYHRCTRCIMDTTASDIWFDETGECKFCKIHDELERTHPLPEHERTGPLAQLVDTARREGRNRQYDCIVGVSGGRDSTYTLLKCVEFGLRPLAVHFDNGWNSPVAVRNIENATRELGVDLETVVADWEEFKSLQLAFLRASVPDAEVPTDYVIHSVLWRAAARTGVRFIFEGHSFRTEGTSPITWTYMDDRYIRAVWRQHGGPSSSRSFPLMSLGRFLYYVFVRRIRVVRLLEHVEYSQRAAGSILQERLGWEYYGGHHHESIFTNFFQAYYLPKKFGIDKRKTEYSALVRSGQMSREEALAEVADSEYPHEAQVVEYAISKLGLTPEQFGDIMNAPLRSSVEFKSYLAIIRALRWPIRVAAQLGLVPSILYLKYAVSEGDGTALSGSRSAI